MKKLLSIIMCLSLIFTFAACSNTAQEEETASQSSQTSTQAQTQSSSQTDGSTGSNVLVAYFAVAENSEVDAASSASVVTVNGEAQGIVQALARMIQNETGGDLFSIQTSVDYPADRNDLIEYAQEEQDSNARPQLTAHIENLDDYDTIFIGYPIWWYDLPQVMYSFFDEYDFSGKTIIPFCVHNGSQFTGTIQTIQELEPNAKVITDGFTVNESNAADSAEDIAAWIEELNL